MTSLVLGIASWVILLLLLILLITRIQKAVTREDLTPGIVKSVLEAGLPPEEEDRVEPGSPHFVAMQEEVFVEKCGCDNCCCGKDSGCGHCFASCLDGVKHSFERWYNVDGRCGGCCSCLNTLCCCGRDTNVTDENNNSYTEIESISSNNTSTQPPIGFKAMKQHAILLALFRSIVAGVGYFTVISVILLQFHGGTSWDLSAPANELFTCYHLFSVTQDTVRHGKDHVLYRLNSASVPEVMICTNMSDFDPEIKKLPGSIQSPNYVGSNSGVSICTLDDIKSGCVGADCEDAFSTPPRPYGVFWSYVFDRKLSLNSVLCSFELTPRPGVSNCNGTNIISLAGYGDSLLGRSLLVPILGLGVFLRFTGQLLGVWWFFSGRCRSVASLFIGSDTTPQKHRKGVFESFACDTLALNFFLAVRDPVRFADVPDSPRYRMLSICAQLGEFFIVVYKVQPCWRWYQLLYVSLQGLLLITSMYDLYRDEIMVARWELLVEKRTKMAAVQTNANEESEETEELR